MAKRGKLDRRQTKEEDVRPFRPRRYDKFILIVCEDQNTEPYYFKKIRETFPKETIYQIEIGTGLKPLGIVKKAVEERNNLAKKIKKEVDEVWVVFDKDDEGNNDTTLKSFNDAWGLANKEKICIAFSNEVFEIWLLLHLIEISYETALPRAEVYRLLEHHIQKSKKYASFEYKHGDSSVVDVVMEIGNEDDAIARATKLKEDHRTKKPIEANPSTSVHELVRHLRELIEWYSYGLKN